MNLKNEPVLVAGGIASGIVLAIITFVIMMVRLEVWMLTSDQINAIRDFVTALVGLGALIVATPFVTSWFARRKVTPLNDPKDKDGIPLVSLADPRDIDGELLTREDNTPAIGGTKKANSRIT